MIKSLIYERLFLFDEASIIKASSSLDEPLGRGDT
jgi:hypothetical protein